MTQGEKAKAYDEAIERARKINSGEGVEAPPDWTICEVIFPELKENEDERIKKELIAFLKENHETGRADETWSLSGIERWIEWLEKQGEQKPKDRYTFKSIPRLLEMIEPTDRAKAYCQKLIDSLLQEGYSTDAKIVSDCLKQMNGEDVPMATMDEQKPTDKVEPKFRPGDWITNNACIIKITSVDDRYYWHDNDCVGGDIESLDKEYHLWTIKDAKKGDVIVDDGDFICIIKSLNESNNTFTSYFFKIGESWGVDALTFFENPRPATREERRQLFDYINNTNEYEWDTEKEELKKIEQKPIDKVEPKFHEGDWVVWELGELSNTLLITKIDKSKNRYLFNDNTDVSFSDERYLRLWTIKDAKDGDILMANAPFIFNGNLEGGIGCPGAHCAINTLGEFQIPTSPRHWTGHTTTPATKEQRDLLFQKMKEAGYEWDADKKELKKNSQYVRVEWSKDDVDMINAICVELQDLSKVLGWSDFGCIPIDACIDWLKSLKQRLGGEK